MPRVFPQFVEVKGTPQHGKNEQVTMGRNNETHQTASKEPRKCQLSETHHNVTLVRGMKSGKFTSNGLVKDFTECSDKCCQRDDCNAAFMVKRTCFSINCLDKDSCTVKPAKPSSFNPTFAYVAKEEQKEQDKGQTNDKVEGQTSDKVKGQQKEQESEQNKMQFKPTGEFRLCDCDSSQGLGQGHKSWCINESALVTPSTSLKICYCPPKLFFHLF